MKKKENNLAFVDGQNLHLGTISSGWKIDYKKFRIYLKDKYKVTEAYYFLGFTSEGQQELYNSLQKAGFIVIFKKHSSTLVGAKKGNVDTDIVFEMMKNLVDNEGFDKLLLVSGDGDYSKVIDYLIEKNRFIKILFPNRKFASSLYKKLGNMFFDFLEKPDIRSVIEFLQKKRVP